MLRTLTKCQNLNSLLTVNKRYIQLLLFWFHFLDLLIKFMKMRLLYILYCPPTPATWMQGPFVFFAILHVPIYRSPPPSGPSRGRVRWAHHAVTFLAGAGRWGRPHAGWQRTQKILVLVTLMPHMQNVQGQNHPCFFVTFLYCQNHREKLILWARNWVHWQNNFLKEDYIFF